MVTTHDSEPVHKRKPVHPRYTLGRHRDATQATELAMAWVHLSLYAHAAVAPLAHAALAVRVAHESMKATTLGPTTDTM